MQMTKHEELMELKTLGEAPDFLDIEGFSTLSKGYLLKGETPRGAYARVSKAAASYYGENAPYWENRFFEVMWKGWLCPASPVMSNMGTARGLPISCDTLHLDDSVDSIFDKVHELAMLSKHGAGVGIYMGDVRGRGALISGNGTSEGIIPWAKVFDSTIIAISQGNVRRGSAALYLPVVHADIDEFLDIRRATGDINRRCLNLNHAVCITNDWMEEMVKVDVEKRQTYQKILQTRVETGEPYLFFTDNVNNQNPECYTDNQLQVVTSNLCSEIMLYTDPEHTFVCCLSSLNLMRWDEWKDTDLPQIATRFLDAVLEEYIVKSSGLPGLEASRRSAIKGRAVGIGVLGWHSLLQSKGLPFDSFESMMLNAQIFKTIRDGAEKETAIMAKELGEPEWCRGFGRRNTHLCAVAPTVSNSIISGGHSPGIEPWAANIFNQRSAKGTFIKKNAELEKLLISIDQNTPEVWKSINSKQGSVQHFDFLTKKQKEIFLTAREINQHAIVNQAAQRQKFIDQGQSINLFFAANSDPKYIHEVHMAAWEKGLKALYYCRSEGVIQGDLASRTKEECVACEA